MYVSFPRKNRDSRGPFYLHGLILIPAPISNTSIIKCATELLIHSQTSTVAPLKFWEWISNLSDTFLGMWLFIHAEI